MELVSLSSVLLPTEKNQEGFAGSWTQRRKGAKEVHWRTPGISDCGLLQTNQTTMFGNLCVNEENC